MIALLAGNRKDWDELTEDLRHGLEPHFVSSYEEVFKLALEYDGPVGKAAKAANGAAE